MSAGTWRRRNPPFSFQGLNARQLAVPPACPSGVLKIVVDWPLAWVALGNDAFAVPVPVACASETPAHVVPAAIVKDNRRTAVPLNCTAKRVRATQPLKFACQQQTSSGDVLAPF